MSYQAAPSFARRINLMDDATFSAAPYAADAFATLRARAPRPTADDFAARRASWLSAPREVGAAFDNLRKAITRA